MNWILISLGGFAVLLFILGIRIVRPIEKGLVETLGKYKKTAEQGFHWIFPGIQKMIKVNVTEQMVDVPEQTVQTSDKLNTKVDAMVYYQVKDVKASEYNVDSHKRQLTSLARTTLRAVMGNMTLTECIQSREKINQDVETVLDKETDSYGVSVLRVEVQRIEPPQDVQEAMNKVVKAEQEKISAKDLATATETRADGERMASIKVAEGNKRSSILEAEGNKRSSILEAEGNKEADILEAEGNRQAAILEAEGKAKAFKLVNDEFKENAQTLKKLEVTQASLENNSKVILTEKGITPQLIIGELPIK